MRCIVYWMWGLAVLASFGSATPIFAAEPEGAASQLLSGTAPTAPTAEAAEAAVTAEAGISEMLGVSEVKDMDIAHQTDAFKVSVHYPVLGVDGVDVDTARWAENLVREFERSAVEEGRDASAPPYQLEVGYTVERPSAGVVSIIFEVATYTGGAHGTLDIIVRTYDLGTKLPLTFSHIFEDPEAALNLMSTYAYEVLRTELGGNVVEDMLKAGTTPDADNFSTLSLRPNGVRIHFAPYQVAPWSQGALFVDMPLEALADARPHLELWGKPAELAEPAAPAPLPLPVEQVMPATPEPVGTGKAAE